MTINFDSLDDWEAAFGGETFGGRDETDRDNLSFGKQYFGETDSESSLNTIAHEDTLLPIAEEVSGSTSKISLSEIGLPPLVTLPDLGGPTLAKSAEVSMERHGGKEGAYEASLDDVEATLLDPEPLSERGKSGEVDTNPIVTPDGRSLEEVILGIRSGTTPADKKLAELKAGLTETTVNGKVKPDDRYTKHAEGLSRKKSKAEKRIAASKKFLQKNSRYTEEEKLIMRSLGMNPKELVAAVSKKSKLTKGDKAKLLKMGALGEERFFKGKRFRATVGDLDILIFLAKFKFASVRILSRLRSEPQPQTWRKLNRLKRGGLVYDTEVIGMGTIWTLTEIGMSFAGYDFRTWRQNAPKVSTLPPLIGINHIAACLWNNEQNVLALDDFPSCNRMVHKAGKESLVQGESLVSELELRSSLSKEIKPTFAPTPDGYNYYGQVGEAARALFHEWDSQGRKGVSPEFEIGQEFCWVLFPNSNLTQTFHVPDLVVARQRDEDGRPRSIAVELELHAKSIKRYKGILMAYKLDKHLYEKVVWVTNNNSIAKKIITAAEEVGLTKFDVVPAINENGIYRNRDIWHI